MQFMNCHYSFLKNSNNDGIRKPVDAIHELPLQRANVAIVIAKFFKKLKCYKICQIINSLLILTKKRPSSRIFATYYLFYRYNHNDLKGSDAHHKHPCQCTRVGKG